uniref:Uncharacterized protein n=1 Tax=Arundo donax TaxID=35708 RepID=A0A0A9AVE5_ARUDO
MRSIFFPKTPSSPSALVILKVRVGLPPLASTDHRRIVTPHRANHSRTYRNRIDWVTQFDSISPTCDGILGLKATRYQQSRGSDTRCHDPKC